jgi:hypothetical protein
MGIREDRPVKSKDIHELMKRTITVMQIAAS